MLKKLLISSALVAAMAAPAIAETTLEYVISNGVIVSVQGYDIPVNYHEDGTYAAVAMGSEIPGTWRIEGTSLCTESSMQPGENCTEYPEGKGPGDSFTVAGAMGPTTITINE